MRELTKEEIERRKTHKDLIDYIIKYDGGKTTSIINRKNDNSITFVDSIRKFYEIKRRTNFDISEVKEYNRGESKYIIDRDLVGEELEEAIEQAKEEYSNE